MRAALFPKKPAKQLLYVIDLDAYTKPDVEFSLEDDAATTVKKNTETLGSILTALSLVNHRIALVSRKQNLGIVAHIANALSEIHCLKGNRICAMLTKPSAARLQFTDFVASHALSAGSSSFLIWTGPSISGNGATAQYVALHDCRFISSERLEFIKDEGLRTNSHFIKADSSNLDDTTLYALRIGTYSHLCNYVDPASLKAYKASVAAP